jgi:hypothetical protein
LSSGSIRDETYTGTDDRVITIGGDESAIDDTGAIKADITGWNQKDEDETGEVTATHDIYYKEVSEEGDTKEGTIVVNSYGDSEESLYEYTINTTTT